MKKIKLLILSLSVVFVSCKSNETADSDKVVQTEIFQSYSVIYNAATKTQTASASFRFGGSNGTTLRLVKNSSVNWNSESMHEDNSIFSGTFYEIIKKGEPITENIFLYTDNDGKQYKNIIPLLKADPYIDKNIIKKQSSNTVNWYGLPSSAMDQVKIIIKDSITEHYFYPSIVGSNNMVLKPSELTQLKEGNANITIQRTVSSSLQNGNSIGGDIYSEYTSSPIIVKIEN